MSKRKHRTIRVGHPVDVDLGGGEFEHGFVAKIRTIPGSSKRAVYVDTGEKKLLVVAESKCSIADEMLHH